MTSTPNLNPCRKCGHTPRASHVRVRVDTGKHATWTVVCKCGIRIGYFSGGPNGGKDAAIRNWNELEIDE
jgi:RNase P subunit RPR2